MGVTPGECFSRSGRVAFPAHNTKTRRRRVAKRRNATADGTDGRGLKKHKTCDLPILLIGAPSRGRAESSVTQCAYCGRENLERAVHCRECGSELCPKPDEKLNGPDGLFARNPMGKRYWNLAAGSLVISIASIMALVAWGPVGHPVEWFLILLPAGIASAFGIVAAVRCLHWHIFTSSSLGGAIGVVYGPINLETKRLAPKSEEPQ